MQVPCLHATLQVLLCGFARPISQWSPLNPFGHLHLFTPLHFPPFKQGIIHFAARLNIKKFPKFLKYHVTNNIHNVNHNILLNIRRCLFVHIFLHSSTFHCKYLKTIFIRYNCFSIGMLSFYAPPSQ